MPKHRAARLERLKALSSQAKQDFTYASHRGDSREPERTVNERLQELRGVVTAESREKKRFLAETANQPSFPPQLGSLLGVPESDSPKPKFGRTSRERMRTPGPPPPKSWLGFVPSYSPAFLVVEKKKKKNQSGVPSVGSKARPRRLDRFRVMTGLDTTDNSPRTTLTHMVLKRLAENWKMIDEKDYPHLSIVPLRLRLQLLPYLGFHGDAISVGALYALTQGKEEVTWLDLSALAGHAPLTLKSLSRFLEAQRQLPEDQGIDHWNGSWNSDDVSILSTPMYPRFINLTHLSLSHPLPTASWRELLDLAKQVPRLTHLSLAHWPWPTMTPNLATMTTIRASNAETRAHSHRWDRFYSGSDSLTEPAALLRQLSSNLLYLQWLDLEGCAEWMPALSILASSEPLSRPESLLQQHSDPTRNPANGDDWIANSRPSVITIFTDMWKNLSYINCSQGWLPTISEIELLSVSVDPELKKGLLHYLEQYHDSSPSKNKTLGEERQRAAVWMDNEMRLRAAGRRINDIRRARGCKPVVFDYGHMQSTMKSLS